MRQTIEELFEEIVQLIRLAESVDPDELDENDIDDNDLDLKCPESLRFHP